MDGFMWHLHFEYKGNTVGAFEGEEYPEKPGQYRYESYRSVGHMLMCSCLEDGGQPRCNFTQGGVQTTFAVVARVAPDMIEIDDLLMERQT